MSAKKKVAPHGENYLKGLEAIQIKLESGKVVELSLDDEMHVPDDLEEILEAAKKAHSRFAFWAYQTERALHVVRKLEQELDKLSAESDLVHRRWYDEHTDEEYTEAMVRSRVNIDSNVATSRAKLNSARRQYGILRSVRDALEHRCHILRRLVAHEADAKKG